MKKIFGVVVSLLVLLLGLAGYFGVFTSIKVTEEEMGPYRLVFRSIPLVTAQEVGEATDKMGAMLDQIGVTEKAPMQVYYSDGNAEIGFVIGDDIRGLILSDGTTVKTLPRQTMMTAVFPWRHATSFVLGQFKVEAAFEQYRQEQSLPEAELMTVYRGNQILYLQPVRP